MIALAGVMVLLCSTPAPEVAAPVHLEPRPLSKVLLLDLVAPEAGLFYAWKPDVIIDRTSTFVIRLDTELAGIGAVAAAAVMDVRGTPKDPGFAAICLGLGVLLLVSNRVFAMLLDGFISQRT